MWSSSRRAAAAAGETWRHGAIEAGGRDGAASPITTHHPRPTTRVNVPDSTEGVLDDIVNAALAILLATWSKDSKTARVQLERWLLCRPDLPQP